MACGCVLTAAGLCPGCLAKAKKVATVMMRSFLAMSRSAQSLQVCQDCVRESGVAMADVATAAAMREVVPEIVAPLKPDHFGEAANTTLRSILTSFGVKRVDASVLVSFTGAWHEAKKALEGQAGQANGTVEFPSWDGVDGDGRLACPVEEAHLTPYDLAVRRRGGRWEVECRHCGHKGLLEA